MTCNLPMLWTDEDWLTKNPDRISSAQVDVNNYLKSLPDYYEGKKALHIGIGNSSMFKELNGIFKQIDGITNTWQELKVGEQLGYRVYFLNKYDLDELNKLDDDYDVIVDVNLKTFSCCQKHWLGYLTVILRKLKAAGRLFSHTAGFGGYPSTFDNSLTMEELSGLIPPGYILTEMKSLTDRSEYYPFNIRKL